MRTQLVKRSPLGLRMALLCLISACGRTPEGREVGAEGVPVLRMQGTSLNGEALNSGGSEQQGTALNGGGSEQQGPALNGPRLRMLGHLVEGATLDGTALGTLSVSGGRLVAERDGVQIGDEALLGAMVRARVIDDRTGVEHEELHRITAIAPAAFDDGESLLYTVERQDEAGAWQPLCAPDLEGRNAAVPVAATWNARAQRVESDRAFTFACTSGAIGKCYGWGYRPWQPHPEGAQAMRDAHQACVRLARADYCGDGVAHTKTGTLIVLWDNLTRSEQGWLDVPGMRFEAAWTPDGAACVNRPRWVNAEGGVQVRCGGRPLPRCTAEDRASSFLLAPGGARLFTESKLNVEI